MSYILEAKDISGKIIHLSDERWSHIVQKHHELSGNIEKVRETIEHPSLITKKEDKTSGKYYRFYKEHKSYLLVVVKYLNGKGFIMTSFFTGKMQ